MVFKAGTDNRTSRVEVRMTQEEKETATENAKQAGLGLSTFMRELAVGRKVHSKADAQIINELRRLGGLVKHIHNQTDGVNSKETAAVLVELVDAIKRVGRE